MNISINKVFIGKICLLLTVFTSFYYPITSVFSIIGHYPSTTINIIIRSISTLVALIMIIFWLIDVKKQPLSLPVCALLVFWIIYSSRIIYDMNQGIRLSTYDSTYIYGFTFGNCLIPLIAIVLWAKEINLGNVSIMIYTILLLTNISILSTIIYDNGGFNMSLFLSRAQVNSDTLSKNDDNVILNPILIGYHGALLMLTSLYHTSLKIGKKKILYYFTGFLGLLNLMLGASRGPFINSVLVLLLFGFYSFRQHKFSMLYLGVRLLIIIALLFVLYIYLSRYINIQDVQMFDRMFSFYESRQNNIQEERDLYFEDAFGLFLDNPLIGSQFVMTKTVGNTYPHNIFIELLMSTGLIGAIFFSIFFIQILKHLYLYYFNNRYQNYLTLLWMIYLQILLGVCFSGTMLMSVEFWLFSALIISIGDKQISKLQL
jgi:O-antigen ligase